MSTGDAPPPGDGPLGRPRPLGTPRPLGAPRPTPAQHPLAPPPAPAPPPRPAGRRRWPIFTAAGLGLAVLVAVAVLFVQGLSGSSGGADDPAGAVQGLADALTGEDPAAALGLVDPTEAASISRLVGQVRDEVRDGDDTGVVRSDGSVAGADVAVEGLQLDTDELGDGVAKVRITGGSVDAKLIAAKLPAGLGIDRDSGTRLDVADADREIYLLARERGGRWYVSAALTALQYLVDELELPQPDFSKLDDDDGGSDGGVRSAATGEELLERVAEVVSSKNVAGAIALTSRSEAGPLRAYADALEQLVNDIEGSMQVELTSADVKEEATDGGLVRLELQRAQGGGSVTDVYDGTSSASVTLSGLCLSTDGEGDGCANELRDGLGIDRGFVLAEKRDDRLRLAPIATLAAYGRQIADHLGGSGLKRLVGILPKTGGQIASGTQADVQLDDSGVAVREYRADAPQYVAVESDRYTTIVGPETQRAPLIDKNGRQKVYRLPAAGTWKLVVASSRFRKGAARVGIRRLVVGKATGSSRLTAPLPKVGPVALYEVPAPGPDERLAFASEGNAYSYFVDPDEGYYGFGEAGLFRGGLFGIGPLVSSGDDTIDRDEYSSSASASASSSDTASNGKLLLVLAGPPGTTLTGSIRTETDSSYDDYP